MYRQRTPRGRKFVYETVLGLIGFCRYPSRVMYGKGKTILLLLVMGASAVWGVGSMAHDWRTASRESAHIAPDPETTPEAVIQVYGAAAYSWRGLIAIHTWISIKPEGAKSYTVYDVVGWRVNRGLPALRSVEDIPDRY